MIGFNILILIICILLFFCCVDVNGKASSKGLLVLMFFIMAFTTDNVDMGAYLSWYRDVDSIWKVGITDPGFGILMLLGRTVGLDYYGFLIALTVLGLAFVTIVIYKKSDCPAIVLAIYFALVFLTLTIQIRAFLAETVIYLLIAEIAEHEKFDVKEFFLLMITAILLHASAFFFMLLLLIALVQNQKKFSIIVTAAIVTVPFSAALLRFIPIPMIQAKIGYYFANRATGISAVYLYVLLYLAVTMLIYYLYARTAGLEWKGKLRRLLQVNDIGLIACAMIVVFGPNFYRIIRVILVGDALVLTNYLYEAGSLRLKNRALYATIVIGLFLVGNIFTGLLLDLCSSNTMFGALLDLN